MSRQGFALIALQEPILPQWIALTTDQSMDRIAPQMVVVIEIFIAICRTLVNNANSYPRTIIRDPIDLLEKTPTAVTGERQTLS